MSLRATRSAACATLALLAACAGGPAPSALPPAGRTPTPVTPSMTPVSARVSLPASIESARYDVQARSSVERDSAGRTQRQTLETSSQVTLTLRRTPTGALRGTGRVDAFTVRGAGDAARLTASLGAATVPSVGVDVALDSAFIRAVPRPPLPNECDRPEAAAAAVARDILVRVPDGVAIGDRWRDSVATVVCRGGVLLTVRLAIDNQADGLRDDGRTLRVRRAIETRLDGALRTPWRQTAITGIGTGTQTVDVDIARGSLRALDGESTLTITVTNGSLRDAARSERVTQHSTLTVRPARP